MSADAFLAAVRAAPADDTPRLVYADWLDENGDPARAEFIRLQCALAHLPDHDPARPALEDREHELLIAYDRVWLGCSLEKFDHVEEWAYRRGFVAQATGTTEFGLMDFLKAAATLHPVERLACHYHTHWEQRDEIIRALEGGRAAGVRELDLSSGYWRTTADADDPQSNAWAFGSEIAPLLHTLDITNNRGVDAVAARLASSALAGRVKSLALGGQAFPVREDAVEVLAAADFAAALEDAPLEDLTAFDCGLTTDGLAAVVNAGFAGTLKSLDVSGNPIAPDGWRAFRGASRELKLNRLDVSGTPLAGVSLDALLSTPALRELTELEMNGCGSARANMEAVAASAFWQRAVELRAHSGTIPASTLEPLFASAGPPGLRVLDLADNYLRADGVRGLCGAAWAETLTWLALSRNYLDDDAVRELASSGRFKQLRTLHLAHNNLAGTGADGEIITDAGAAALASSPGLANLRILTVSFTGVSARGAEILLNGPHWNLSGLGLGGCNLTPAAVEALARSPKLARLEWLDLSTNPGLRWHALRPLAESEYLSPLCELDVGGVGIAAETRAALQARLGPRLSD